ncbi:MAG: DUF721 domain-containing protein [Gemmatimonadales bacterium]
MSGHRVGSRSERLGRERGERPEAVGDLVPGLLDRLGVSERVERAGVALDWEELVGPHISRVTVGTRVSGRTLFVEVISAAWLSELNMMRHELLRRINAGRRRGRIEKIVFVQAGKG